MEDYRVGDKFGVGIEYWYTEKNTTGNTSYDGILHTFWVGKNETDWEHYYRLRKDSVDNVDILEISSKIIGWEQKLPTGWQTLKRISKPE